MLSTSGDWLRELARHLNRANAQEAAMSFEWPLALLGLLAVPLIAGAVHRWPSAGGARTRCASRTSTCSAAS